VHLADRLRLKLPAQEIEGRLALGEEDDPGGLRVQAVDGGHVLAVGDADQADERRPGLLVPGAGGDRQAARLVKGHEQVVLGQDVGKGHGGHHPSASGAQGQRFRRR
jgi:hypothetical protein